MNTYITGSTIRALREKKQLTQAELAAQIDVSGKTISKWETSRGLPDITILESLAKALGVSVIELLSGEHITNKNRSSNLLRSQFYVCPICGNVIHSTGDALISCCGITLPALEAEEPDEAHRVQIEPMEDEQFLTFPHPMSKDHFITFAAFVTTDQFRLVKFYPEGSAETRMQLRGNGILYYYCNKHGLFRQQIQKGRPI